MSNMQLSLPLASTDSPVPASKPRRVKPHHRPRIDAPLLPLQPRRYLPVVGVPETREGCPDTSKGHCPHLRCRWNLHLETADHRAGRPGLAHAPRDARGLIVSTPGDLGDERPGTTANARWLELERRCRVWVERDEHGRFVTLHAEYESEWEHFKERLHMGEAIDVLVDGERVGGARMTPDGVALNHEPQWSFAVLQRVRGVASCALDEIARRGKHSNQQAGDAVGRHRTLVARELKDALRKACETAVEMGMDAEDFVGALMGMGRGA